jgi:hypothetical protein
MYGRPRLILMGMLKPSKVTCHCYHQLVQTYRQRQRRSIPIGVKNGWSGPFRSEHTDA